MKRILLSISLLSACFCKSQTYNFTTVKKDTTVSKINTTIIVDRDNKKLYVKSNSKDLVFTFYINRYSVADKYQLVDCKDSLTGKSSSVEIYQGKKETYATIENGPKFILK